MVSWDGRWGGPIWSRTCWVCIFRGAWHVLWIQGNRGSCNQCSLLKHFASLPTSGSANIWARFQTRLTPAICLFSQLIFDQFSQSSTQGYPTLGHSLVDEELQYFQQWILCLSELLLWTVEWSVRSKDIAKTKFRENDIRVQRSLPSKQRLFLRR